MNGNGFIQGTYRISEWIMRLAYVNLLWLVFIVVGGIIFGVGPSTAAMFSVTRKWVMGEDEIPVFKTFWSAYKKEFKTANILTLLLVVIGFIFYIDLKVLNMQEGTIYLLIKYLILVFSFIMLIITMYIFPIFVHYELKTFQYIRNAFLFSIMNPFITITMAIGCGIVYYGLTYVPGLIPFFGGSIFSIVLMYLANRSFIRIEMVQNMQNKSIEE